MKVRLTEDCTFEAALTLPTAPEGHKCRKIHGHSFKLEVSVEGEGDPYPPHSPTPVPVLTFPGEAGRESKFLAACAFVRRAGSPCVPAFGS